MIMGVGSQSWVEGLSTFDFFNVQCFQKWQLGLFDVEGSALLRLFLFSLSPSSWFSLVFSIRKPTPQLCIITMVCLSNLSAISKEQCEQVEEFCCNLKTVLRLGQFKNWEERWKINTRPSPKIEDTFPNHRWTSSALPMRWSLATASCGTRLETLF